jgi:hypothetical protein
MLLADRCSLLAVCLWFVTFSTCFLLSGCCLQLAACCFLLVACLWLVDGLSFLLARFFLPLSARCLPRAGANGLMLVSLLFARFRYLSLSARCC